MRLVSVHAVRVASALLLGLSLVPSSGCAGFAARARKSAEARATAAITARAVAAAAAAQEAAAAAHETALLSADSAAALRVLALDTAAFDSAAVRGTSAEDTRAGWDSRAARLLMQRASMRRAAPLADSTLHNYRGVAEGYLYLYGDRPSASQQMLVRVIQMGLELYWRQPGLWRQRIVGMRQQSPIPNGARFHLDHFTMVQNGFGNTIRVGGGDEVRDVMHPAAPGASTFYHFRVADSLEIDAGGHRVRVYAVEVKPRDVRAPAMVGTVYLDKASAAIVRMSFTFTPASYVGMGIDYINISLDNALYENKYWLANNQLIEIRRAIPLIDFGVGTVISSRIHVRDYELNAEINDSIFRAPPIVRERRGLRDFAFERGVFDDLENAGLKQPVQLSELRKEAESIVKQELLSGLPPLRPYAPGLSSLLRYNRAEGLYIGTGLSYTPRSDQRYDLLAGFALGSDQPALHGRAIHTTDASVFMLEGFLRRTVDLDPAHPGGTFVNSFSAATAGRDYLDLWYASGARASLRRTLGASTSLIVGATIEKQTSASLEKERAMLNRGASFRSVLPITDGRDVSASLTVARSVSTWKRFAWSGSASLTGGRLEDESYAKPTAAASITIASADRQSDAHLSVIGGVTSSSNIAQQLFLIGGRGTLPGYDYRSFAGRQVGLANLQLSTPVYRHVVGLRALAAAGMTGGIATTSAVRDLAWPVQSTGGVRTSAGAGVALFSRTMNIDLMRGLQRGHWEIVVSAGRSLGNIN